MASETKESAADHSFRQRALTEAARYGSDPWVFVRELLQNARDAGAREVVITTSQSGSSDAPRQRFTCRDDGSGMTFEHARRYLFALYASSKDDDRAQAGKFGIGFWSILRLTPTTIKVRSRAEAEDAWEITLDGGLERASSADVDPNQTRFESTGTEVILELPPEVARDLAAEARGAARRYGCFLTRRDELEQPLRVSVNGICINAEFSLPAPCSSFHGGGFRGGGFRGVVGLGDEPRVDLFAQGLFVRSASSLQDLQDVGGTPNRAATEESLAGLPSLAPRVLIDSAELDLMLARSDVRYDKHMRRILRSAEKALARLIQQQLQALRPQPWYRSLLGTLRDRIDPFLRGRYAAAAAAGIVLGLINLWWLPKGLLSNDRPPETARLGAATAVSQQRQDRDRPTGATRDPERRSEAASRPLAAAAGRVETATRNTEPNATFFPYSDLARSYRGPRPGGLRGDRLRAAIQYEPETASPFFNALVVDEISATRWAASTVPSGSPRYRSSPCRSDCLQVRLLVADGSTPLRIPVATGHRLDVSSVRLDSQGVAVYETRNGEAVLLPEDRRRGLLEYRTGPAPRASPPLSSTGTTLRTESSAELAEIAATLRSMPVEARVQRALDYVARRVTYDRSLSTAKTYARSINEHSSFVDAALAVAAGDCDVQSGVLLSLLQMSGTEARLALGYVGIRGTVAAGLHAWVEYRDASVGWSIADASVSVDPEIAGSLAAAAAPPPSSPSAPVLIPKRAAAGLDASIGTAGQLTSIAILFVVLGATAVVMRQRRFIGAVELGTNENLAALLGGALRHPEAFAGMPAISYGRFVPLLDRSAGISLHRARRLGNDNRLFRSDGGSTLAHQAAARKTPVIDASTPEGRVLSLALGAIDLDRWSSLLKQSLESRLCQHINPQLDSLNAPWRLREASDLPEPWIEIALEELRLGQRLILVDMRHLEFAPARELLPERPAAAAFTVLDVLLHRLDMAGRDRARILAHFATAAIAEQASPEDHP